MQEKGENEGNQAFYNQPTIYDKFSTNLVTNSTIWAKFCSLSGNICNLDICPSTCQDYGLNQLEGLPTNVL